MGRMTLQLANIAFDCDDALAVANFWSSALDRPLDPDSSKEFAAIGMSDGSGVGSDDGPAWLFAKVPEGKRAKNRCHVDLTAADRETEVTRLVAAGAVRLADKDEWGHRWTVLADPEGNEFCVAQQRAG
jgi:predicted enzyme related to lactoylglutathione lyase